MSTKGTPAAAFLFLSTPSARRATLSQQIAAVLAEISIHALREEGDERSTHFPSRSRNFYPRPPRGGRPIRATQASSQS